MYDAIVTFVGMEPDDISQHEMANRIARREAVGHPITKVYRLEFESEEGFQRWLCAGGFVKHNRLIDLT